MSQKGLTTFSSHERGLAPILIVLLIALAIGGYFVYQNQTKPIPPSLTTQPSPSPSATNLQATSSSETANWKTYRNLNLGIEFKYPDDLKIVTENANSVSFSGLFQPGNQRVSSFTISKVDIIDIKNLKLCSELTASTSYCIESRKDIKKRDLAGIEAIEFPAAFGDNSGAQWSSYQIVQTTGEPIIELKQPVIGGGATDLDRVLPTLKFLK